MDRLLRERKALRAVFTRACTTIEQAPETRGVKENGVVLLNQLVDKYNRLEAIHTQVLNLMLETDVSEEDYMREFEAVEEYRERFIIARCSCERKEVVESIAGPVMKSVAGSIAGSGVESIAGPVVESDAESIAGSSVSSKTSRRRRFKLPVLKLKRFSSDPKDWVVFWGQFRKIHEDDDIEAEDKFQYLSQCMEPGTRAAGLIERFPPSAENYPLAVECLKQRFARDELLIQVYVRQLLGLVMENAISGKVTKNLSNLYDRLETSLRALGTLGCTKDKFAHFLAPLVESCLPENILRIWERQRSYEKIDKTKSTEVLDHLMEFLQHEVEGDESIALVKESFGCRKPTEKVAKEVINHKKNRQEATASVLITTDKASTPRSKDEDCAFCSKKHLSQDCFTAKRMSEDEKKRALQTSNRCFICFRMGHGSKTCKTIVSCMICDKRHYTVMCPNLKDRRNKIDSKPKLEKENKISKEEDKSDTKVTVLEGTSEVINTLGMISRTLEPDITLLTLPIYVKNEDREILLRCILDTGAQRSYITAAAARRLNLKPRRKTKVAHGLFGGSVTDPAIHVVYRVNVHSIHKDFQCSFEAWEQKKICGEVASLSEEDRRAVEQYADITLTHHPKTPTEIDMLLGADVAGSLITVFKEAPCGLTAVHTKLGWTAMGPSDCAESQNVVMTTINLYVKEMKTPELWSMDALGIRDPIEACTDKKKQANILKQFRETIKITKEGRYQVDLPFKEHHAELPSYKAMAIKRHQSMMSKLKKDGLFHEYQAIFDDWEKKQIIEKVPSHQLTRLGCYLPHRPVIKNESSTTKIRPVFDASAKVRREVSLNECLEKGGNLIEEIPGIIDRFRKHTVGVTADVEKAFLQLQVNAEHRDFLRFFNPNGQEYRHCRVVFGVTSSPFLLGAVLGYHLSRMKTAYRNTVERLEHSFYVDNLVTSVSTVSELNVLRQESTELMKKAQMNLRCWITNVEFNSKDGENATTLVLGLKWNLERDTLACNVSRIRVDNDRVFTKREVLAVTHQVFDPIGFVSPLMVWPKLLLKELWRLNIGWDEPLPEALNLQFKKWAGQLHRLGELEIPRCVGLAGKNQIHVFADASKDAYAACVFIRTAEADEIKVQLIRAKSRLAPKGSATIPRLELLACTIAARLARSVVEALSPLEYEMWFWSDSTTALWWIKEEGQWEVFVRNRVKEIRELTDIKRWFHIPGENNAADLPSRGCSLYQLKLSRWWEGPPWLKRQEEEWPIGTLVGNRSDDIPTITLLDNREAGGENPFDSLKRLSSYHKILRAVSWVYRFMSNCKPGSKKVTGIRLLCRELMQAEENLWLQVQHETYGLSEKNYPLEVIRDSRGLMKAKLQIHVRKDDENFLCPIVLPGKHELVVRLIESIHRESCHAGFNILWSRIRERFWIIGARRALKLVIKQCLNCKKLNDRTMQAPPAVLPQERVRDSAVFETTGVDLAGPLLLRNEQKVWIVLYTCAVYRAVHLDLVTALSADVFLQSLRRFIARRGRPRLIYSDNATNFKRAAEDLSPENWAKVAENAAGRRIDWRFNPPSAPWWGGWWERMVRMVKDLLRRTLGRAVLSYEELSTVLCEVEAVINSRPLTYLAEEEKLIPLTPASFLQELPEVGVPELEVMERDKMHKRLRYRQNLMAELRRRFRDEYLGQLKARRSTYKVAAPVKIDDVVLISDDNKRRLMWPLARVIEVYPGRDGHVRCVKLKTAKGILIRPIQRLVPLEISTTPRSGDEQPIVEVIQENDDATSIKANGAPAGSPAGVYTRSGRLVKTPQRLGLLNQEVCRFEPSSEASMGGGC